MDLVNAECRRSQHFTPHRAIIACLLWHRHWGLKLLVVATAVPIAVMANGFRIWLTGWLSVRVGPAHYGTYSGSAAMPDLHA